MASDAVTMCWQKINETNGLKSYFNKPSLVKGIKPKSDRQAGQREEHIVALRSFAIPGLQNAVIVKENSWNLQQDVFGSVEDICNNARPSCELYYRNTKGNFPTRFFLDLDPVVTVHDNQVADVTAKWEIYLQKFVDAATVILGVSSDQRVYVDHKVRSQGARMVKLSAHLVWPGVVFASSNKVKTYFTEHFMPRLQDNDGFGTVAHLLRFLDLLEGREPTDEERNQFICDKTVYNATRLFRGPLQMKLGDANSVLSLGWTQPQADTIQRDSRQLLSAVWNDRNPFCWGLQSNFDVPEQIPRPVRPVEAERPHRREEQELTFGAIYPAHYKMIAHFFWPAYMHARANASSKLNLSGDVNLIAGDALKFVPSGDLQVSTHNGIVWTSTFEVPGDSYCMCDPRGYHRNNPNGKITFQINVTSMAVKQLCWVCGAEQAITTALTTTGMPIDETKLLGRQPAPTGAYRIMTKTKGRALQRLFLAYLQDRVVYRPTQMEGGRNFYIYCDRKDFPIWTSDDEAVQNVLTYSMDQFIDSMAEECALLTRAQAKHGAEEAQDADNNEESDDLDQEVAFNTMQEYGLKWKNNNPQHSFKLHNYSWAPSNTQVDINDGLVGFRNNMAFDVKTGAYRPIKKDDMITGTIFANVFIDANNRLDVAHPQCLEIHKWFKDIAAGRNDLALYLKRLCGYSFTRMVFDRKFYVLYGAGSDGKSTLGKFFQECLGHDRYFSVPCSFFGDSANAKTSAESATANAAHFYGKTCAMTEDMAARALDSAKIKSYSAGDRVSGRKLYSNTCSWKQSSKLWFATNVDPVFSTLDQAIMDRLIVIPMDTRWIRNPNYSVGEKMADPRYLETLLTYTDAFATVVLHAFSQFLLTHQACGDQFFPIPTCVRERTEQYIKDNHPYKRYIMECLETEKQFMPDNQCCMGVMSVFQAYNAFKKHVEAKGDKTDDTEGNFRKTMQVFGISVCPMNDCYPYYHKTSARKYFPDYHCMRRHDEIMLMNNNSSSSSMFVSESSSKRHCSGRISADANVY